MMNRDEARLIVKEGPAPSQESIDGFQFARSSGFLEGRLAAAELPRLAESGCVMPELSYELHGMVDSHGIARLRIAARGDLKMTCQRCLGPVTIPVAIDSVLQLAASRDEIETADDDQDRVLAKKAMPVATLVEDEVLLVLPMVPRHERCEAATGAGHEQKRSPFAALARLKH